MVVHIGEHRGGFPQQTQTAEVGLQPSPLRVLEDLPHISSLAHTACLCVQRESSNPQVHKLGAGLQRNGNQHTLDYYWDPETWLFPPVPLIPLPLEGVLE